MPVPYSDNLYSALDDEDDEEDYALPETEASALSTGPNEPNADEEEEALSPADGYFHASDAVAYDPSANAPQSSNVPVVPNVLVEDPTLRDDDRDAKTREAENERRLSNMASLQSQPHHHPGLAQSPPASSSRPIHSHRRSVEEDDQDLAGIHESSDEHLTGSLRAQSQHLQQQHHHHHHHHHQHHQHTLQQTPRPSETSPLFQHQHFDAPPAYTPSPTTPSQPSQHTPTSTSPVSADTSVAGYHTFASPSPSSPTDAPIMGLPSEHQRLLPNNREPQSMGGESVAAGPVTFGGRVRRAFRVRDGRRRLATVLKWLVIVGIVLMVFSSFTISGKHHPSDKIEKPEDPTQPPPKDGTGSPPKDPAQPPDKSPRPPITNPGDGQQDLKWTPRLFCREPEREFRIQASWGAEFGPSQSFAVSQKITNDVGSSSNRQPDIEGEVIIRPTRDTARQGTLKVEVVSNSKDLETSIQFDSDPQHLRITTPRKVEWHYALGPCIQMRVTVFVPAGGKTLGDLAVNTTQLNIQLAEGLDLGVQNEALLKTISGDVNAPKKEGEEGEEPYRLSNRRTVVDTVSGNVKGWFALNDLLKVSSISGDVTLDVGPQKVNDEDPQRAELILSTASGDISATEPIQGTTTNGVGGGGLFGSGTATKFPARDYYVDVSTVSGHTTGSLAFSSYANIRSQSGNQRLRLWPVLDPDDKEQPRLSTNTKSGDVDMTLLEPAWVGIVKPKDQRLEGPPADDGEENKKHKKYPWIITHPHDAVASPEGMSQSNPALGNVLSRHSTISGNVKLRYPASWEGNVLVETISGSQRVRGEGLDIYDVGTPLMKTRTGRKGKGSSDLKVVTVSGDEDLLIGREV